MFLWVLFWSLPRTCCGAKKSTYKILSHFYITSQTLNLFLYLKKNKTMQQKIFYIAVVTISAITFFFLLNFIKSNTSHIQPRTTHQEQRTYSIGITKQHYKQGKDSITTKTKSFHSFSILTPSAADTSYTFSAEDSSYKLSLNLKPDSIGNISLDYFLTLTSKDLIRIDTIIQTRIDTLKIKEVLIEKEDPPFYNTFIFGTIVTGSIILLLINILK